MHHIVFGINFQIHSVSLTILVSIHLLIHFSTHLYHHPHSRHPSLLHSFTPGSKPTFQQILPTADFFYLLDCLTITKLDRTYHAHHYRLKAYIVLLFFDTFRNKSGKPQPIRTKVGTHTQVKGRQRSRNLGRGRLSGGEMGG